MCCHWRKIVILSSWIYNTSSKAASKLINFLCITKEKLREVFKKKKV